MMNELAAFSKLITENNVGAVLVDSYYVTERYLSELKKLTRIYYIDDLNSMICPSDVLINYNIYGEESVYRRKYGTDTALLMGPLYAPLRAEFSHIKPRSFGKIKNVLITSGGTDEFDVIGNVLSRMTGEAAFSDLDYYCVIGRFNRNTDSLYERYGNDPHIHFLHNINNMSDYMQKCDVCISAGGTTSYELCACGLPSIMYTLADNQTELAGAFSRKGIIPWVGDVRENLPRCMDNIVKEMLLLNDSSYRESQSLKMQQIVDGRGAARIADAVIKKNYEICLRLSSL